MKILFINYSDKGGGAERVVWDMHKGTEQSDLFVHHSSDRINEAGILTKVIQKFTPYKSLHHALGLLDSFHGIYKKLKKLKAYREADIVHLHNIHGGWFDISALQKIDREKPIVWTLHDMWALTGGEAHVFDHTGYRTGEAITPFQKNYPLNNPLIDNRPYYLRKKKNLYSSLKRTTFVPVSHWLESCIRSAFVYNDGMKIHTIKNGIDSVVFQNHRQRAGREKKRILFFNSKSPFKGTELGLQVLKQIEEEAEVWIVGEMPDNLKNAHSVSQFIGSRERLAQIYNQVDILFFPSLAETFPLTILEAMACGVVVVTTGVGGIPEIITDGHTGYITSTPDKETLLAVLERALRSDLFEIGARAAAFVAENHSQSQMMENYQKLYSEVLADRKKISGNIHSR